MTYLLDTHTLLWFLRSPDGLPKMVRELLEDPATTLAVSIVTPWEISIKNNTGRINAQDILDDFDSILIRGRFNLLGASLSQVIQSGRLPLFHRDPFDRLLAAQSLDLGWTLLSKDAIFDAYGARRLWD
jgi:PIN domain nuclease of toxin-antitoxin system